VLNWRELVRCTDDQLARLDIAAVNLACAEGLPGAETIDTALCLSTLDGWADAVRSYTDLLMPQFRRKPHEYDNSEAYFRALALITVLHRDRGVKYNRAKIPEDVPFDTADVFIHGIIQGDGGTCATLPVVYAAVGRRLGYPIKLASTLGKNCGHLFARWDEPGSRFNMEASNNGFGTATDDELRKDPYHDYHLPPDVEADGCLLQSKTPKMELADFMSNRALRFDELNDWRQSVEAWAWTHAFQQRNKFTLNSLKRSMTTWDRDQRRRMPAAFPPLVMRRQGRLYPAALPLEVERDIHGLWAVENMLSDPRLEAKYWSRMRRGDNERTPSKAVATFLPNEACYIDLRFD
jgi:hypothetical protein